MLKSFSLETVKPSILFVSAIIFSLLFWLVASFIYRDAKLPVYWAVGGFLLGLVNGVTLKALQDRAVFVKKLASRKIFFIAVLLAEFALGLLLIGPYIWVKLRFVPTSNIHSICCETPREYGAAHYENVKLSTEDGATIAGWYVAPTTQTGKVIILIHGYGYDRRGTDFQTRILISAGYGVLLYDLRDHGESQSNGSLNSFNRMQVYARDLLQVVNYLKQKSDVEKIGVVGISLGAFATLNSSPETLNGFSALWLDGLRFENFGAQLPVDTPVAFARSIFDQQTRLLASLYGDSFIPSAPLTFAQIIPAIHKPNLMLVSSGLDESERGTNEKLIPLLGDKKELWIIENAWHIGGRFDAPDEYREKMLAFFAAAFSQNN